VKTRGKSSKWPGKSQRHNIGGARIAAAIQELSDLEGPDVDEARKSLPVPAIALELPPDGSDWVDETPAGSPGADGGAGAPLKTPAAGPEAELDLPARDRTVFGNDDRYIYHDSSYPFSTIGRLAPSGCTGAMVGPRHVLTASHCITWTGDDRTTWVRFEPSLYGAEKPYGEAWAERVLWYRQIDTDNDGRGSERDTAFDFVVLVLDRRMGEETGWMGTRTYSSDWNGREVWSHAGYPVDRGQGVRPAYQGGCSVTETVEHTWDSLRAVQLRTRCDTNHGQSGSPLWGRWGRDRRIIGVDSASVGEYNAFAGGRLLSTLVRRARELHP
jgi:V8-like Glu-specific endopeptidase